MAITKIISGGQTGVDRAALDVAIELGIPCGGWCPRERKASDGVVPSHYPVTELPSGGYRKRTKWNVRDSDGTLIISPIPMSGGTLLTANLARKHNKPLFLINLDSPSTEGFRDWLRENRISVLNIAGPREQDSLTIYDRAQALLRYVLH